MTQLMKYLILNQFHTPPLPRPLRGGELANALEIV